MLENPYAGPLEPHKLLPGLLVILFPTPRAFPIVSLLSSSFRHHIWVNMQAVFMWACSFIWEEQSASPPVLLKMYTYIESTIFETEDDVNIKSLCSPWRRRGNGDIGPGILNRITKWKSVVTLALRPLFFRERASNTRWGGGCVGLSADLDSSESRKMLYVCRESITIPQLSRPKPTPHPPPPLGSFWDWSKAYSIIWLDGGCSNDMVLGNCRFCRTWLLH